MAAAANKAHELYEQAELFEQCAKALEACGESMENSQQFVAEVLDKFGVPADKIKQGADGFRKGTAEALRDHASTLWDVGLCAAEAALLVAAWMNINAAVGHLAKTKIPVGSIRTTLEVIRVTHFSSEEDMEAMFADATKRQQVRTSLENVEQDIALAEGYIADAQSSAFKGGLFGLGGIVLGGAMAAGYGATSLVARLLGGAGAAASTYTTKVAKDKHDEATAMQGELQIYSEWIAKCKTAIDNKNQNLEPTAEMKAELLKSSQDMQKLISEKKAEAARAEAARLSQKKSESAKTGK